MMRTQNNTWSDAAVRSSNVPSCHCSLPLDMFAILLGILLSARPTASHAHMTPAPIIIFEGTDLSVANEQVLGQSEELLLMIPGISSGIISNQCSFLNDVNKYAQCDSILFYDWEPTNPGRKVVARTATRPAARKLIKLLATYTNTRINVIAHSAGTVVLNTVAEMANEQSVPIQFNHVLLLGTALDAAEPLTSLRQSSQTILNVHSSFDKVNRNINDQNGFLTALHSGRHHNLQKDRTLGGRLVRHNTFLETNPENSVQYGTYLQTGTWPAIPTVDSVMLKNALPNYFNALTSGDVCKRIKTILEQETDPTILYFTIILAGTERCMNCIPSLTTLTERPESPAFLRKEAYRALGSMRAGTLIPFLKNRYKTDPDCSSELRDILRELKRERITPVYSQ